MSAGDISAINTKSTKKSRRRKKRRTADVSSSSDSSSDSSSFSENEVEEATKETAEETVTEDGKIHQGLSNGKNEDEDKDVEMEVSDVELSDEEKDESLKLNSKEIIDDSTKISLSKLSEPSRSQNKDNFLNASKIAENIKSARSEYNGLAESFTPRGKEKSKLREEYLNLLFTNYGDDINRLRSAPDFTNKSLSILADVLDEGIGMFDIGELESILKNKEMEK
ncbi:hypothetical protein N7582_003902 [Saccharomyces uvarum]|uniref:Ribosome assembly protein 3 n=1 Tax=Saccharomyces uvarum TaxID=230603 RepID=A0AA35J2X1_SACUV|nr:hypothetical protein N7582_003902 [Saccharomyces uvarum]CAI4046805.1 hypothetical protein SUVC_12G2660 [Saccharomyces uvarum]